jgi:hypothetical protein
MLLSITDFQQRVSDASALLGKEISDAFGNYALGRDVDFKTLLAKNTKIQSVRNWHGEYGIETTGVGGFASKSYINVAGYYDSMILPTVKLISQTTGREVTVPINVGKPTITIIDTVSVPAGNYIQYTSSASHNLEVGNVIMITGYSGIGPSFEQFDGFKTVSQITSSTVFRVSQSGLTSASTGLTAYASYTMRFDQYMTYVQSVLNTYNVPSSISTTTGVLRSGYGATLTQGLSKVTLTTGNTAGLASGQAITSASGSGAFNTAVVITNVESSTVFYVDKTHTTSGSVTFSVNSEDGTIILTSPKAGACYYNNYLPTITVATSTTPITPYRTYVNPYNLSQLGFHLGQCSKRAGTYYEYSSNTDDQIEQALNEVMSTYNV